MQPSSFVRSAQQKSEELLQFASAGVGTRIAAAITVWTHPSEQHRSKTSLEFAEGKRAYADGIDGYAATPYDDSTQQMTDWFAGWIAAKNAYQMQAAHEVAA